MDKPEILYPCRWPYKVIGSDRDQIERELPARLEKYDFTMTEGKESSKGRFISINVEVSVASEKERLDIHYILQNITSVKMVF